MFAQTAIAASCSIWLALAAAPQTRGPDFEAWREHILPTYTEGAWLEIPWRRDLTAAVFEAEARVQPLLIWTVDGDPFGCNCKGRAERRFLWATPALRDLSELFVPACAGAGDLLRNAFFAGVWSRAELTGEVPGRGVFACAPDGTLLGAIDSTDAAAVREVLEAAVLKWHELPDSARRAGAGPRPAARQWPEGSSLEVTVRDLPDELDPAAPRSLRWNRDHVWWVGKEARSLVPKKLSVGKKRKVPGTIVRRLARWALLDNALGPTLPFGEGEVREARLESRVVRLEGERVHLELRGATRTRSEEDWPRALETKLSGLAVWNRDSGELESLELLALGSRRGRTPENGRPEGQDPTPIGFVIRLAGSPSALNVPRFHDG